MIPRWRRDHTVFMGTGGPVEDATWLFRLRMAELKRVSAERVSDPQPWTRFFGRMFDYGVWGVLLLGLLGLLRWAGPDAAQFANVLGHPLLAPILITASWIPVEALLLAQIQTTPGRWLMSVYLHYQVSNPYAPEELRFTFAAALRRARDVWWSGCGGGLPLFSMVTVARANEHILRSGETRWDSQRDCLVTHGPVGTLCLVSLAIGLAACALAFSAWWLEPAQSIGASVQQVISATGDRFAARRDTMPAPVQAPPSRIARVDDVATPPPAPPISTPAAPDAPSTLPAAETATKGSAATESSARGAATKASALPAAAAAAAKSGGSAPPVKPVPAAASSTPSRQIAVPVAPGSDGADTASKSGAPELANASAPTSLELRDKRIAKYAQKAKVQQANGDFAGLERTCRRWTDEDWRDPRAFYCLGLGLQGIGRHREAIATFNKAGELLPRDDPLAMLIADAVLRSFRAESAK